VPKGTQVDYIFSIVVLITFHWSLDCICFDLNPADAELFHLDNLGSWNTTWNWGSTKKTSATRALMKSFLRDCFITADIRFVTCGPVSSYTQPHAYYLTKTNIACSVLPKQKAFHI